MTDSEATARPRLLLVTHFYPSHGGGVEIVAGQLAARLATDIGVRWAAGRDRQAYPPPRGVELVPLGVWHGIERRTGVPVPLPGVRALARLWREVRRSDLVWVHDLLYPGNLLAAVAARIIGRPLVVTVHVGAVPYRNSFLRGFIGFVYRATSRTMLRAAARVTFVSERIRDETARRSWKRPPLFIPNGVDAGVFHPSTDAQRAEVRRYLGGETRPLLVFVGRFVERKGLALIQQLAERTPEWRWVLAGHGPIDPGAWAAANVSVERELHGPSLARLYGAADLLVLPSLGEGFPLVVIEALACGTPAIVDPSTAAGDRTAAARLETEPVTGSDAVDRWHAHLERILARPDLDQARTAVAEFAASHWSWDRAADAYREVLEEALSASRR
ncbi:MAG: glycosyltransferase family 4 protein [Chloroflexota bacterium]